VKLLALPLELWIVKSLTVIRNLLGKKLLIDDIFLTSNVRFVARLLVEIDVSLGLYESVNFVMGGRKYS